MIISCKTIYIYSKLKPYIYILRYSFQSVLSSFFVFFWCTYWSHPYKFLAKIHFYIFAFLSGALLCSPNQTKRKKKKREWRRKIIIREKEEERHVPKPNKQQ